VNVITKSATPVLLGDWLEPGQHVNAAGSNALTRRELDLRAVQRCELIAVDSRETARKECGDLLPLVEAGWAHWESLAEIGEIAAGLRPGRTSDQQITLYESHGMAIQDLYTARKVYDLARAQGLGREVPGRAD
jgi:ornithine cyclodeaminase